MPTMQISEEDSVETISQWKRSFVRFMKSYPIFEDIYAYSKDDNGSLVSVFVKHQRTSKLLTKEEVAIISEGMALDLKGKFDWDRVKTDNTAEMKHYLYVDKLNADQYEDILSYRCDLGQSVQVSKKGGVLRISLDS